MCNAINFFIVIEYLNQNFDQN